MRISVSPFDQEESQPARAVWIEIRLAMYLK